MNVSNQILWLYILPPPSLSPFLLILCCLFLYDCCSSVRCYEPCTNRARGTRVFVIVMMMMTMMMIIIFHVIIIIIIIIVVIKSNECAGLTSSVNEEKYLGVCEAASELSPQPITFLTALLHLEEDVRPIFLHDNCQELCGFILLIRPEKTILFALAYVVNMSQKSVFNLGGGG